MRNPLRKRFPRELRHNLGKYLGLFLMMTFAVSFTSGFLMSSTSIAQICYGMDERYHIEDAYVTTDFKADKAAVQAAQECGAVLIEDFYKSVPLALDDDDRAMTARVFKDRTQVNLAAYAQGAAPQAAGEIAVDRVFAANHELQVGDSIEVAGAPFTVCGILTLPDYQALFENSSDFMFNAITFTVALVTPEAYDAFAGAQETYKYAVVFNDPALDLSQRSDLEEDIAVALVKHGAQVSDLADAEDNQAVGYAIDDVEGDSVMWVVLMLILVVIMAFVFVVLTGATIEAESSVIGTLLASGWRKAELVRHYVALPALVGAMACVVGVVIGQTVLAQPFQGLYYNSYSLPPYELTWNWGVIVLTTVLPYVLLVGITLLGLMRRLGCTPLQFLRHELSHNKRRHSVALPARLGYPTRFRLRVLMRNASHFITLFFGVMFASLLMLFGVAMMPVVKNAADLMAQNVAAPYEYVLKSPVELEGSTLDRKAWASAERIASTEDMLGSITERGFLSDLLSVTTLDTQAHPVNSQENDAAAIAQAEKFALTSVEVERALFGKYESVNVYGVSPTSAYWNNLGLQPGAVVAGRGLIEKTKAEVGSPCELRDRHAGKTYTVMPTAEGSTVTDMSLYLTLDDFNALFGNEEDYFNGYASAEVLAIDERYLATTITPSDMTKLATQLEDSMGSIVSMMLFMAIPIYLILVYLLTKTVIDRSARAISYMKVFGYRNREVNGLYVRPVTYAVAISLVLSLPIIYWLIVGLMKVMFMYYSGNFPLIIGPELYVEVVVIGMVTYALVAVLHIRRIKRVPLALAMKVQE